MTLILDTQKLASVRGALARSKPLAASRRYCIQTFGCQMNQADSEKIQMLLTQAGLSKVDTWEEADIVIFNTCSVRQKGEDKVFGYVEEIDRLREKTGRDIKVGLTGCMTRKTGLNRKYYSYQGRKNVTKIELLDFEDNQIKRQLDNQIDSESESPCNPIIGLSRSSVSLFNSDDELFGRTDNIDFVVRIEEIGSLTTLLSVMYGEDVGQDDTFQSYLRVRQDRDNSGSANVIIQTGCDNYCTFCIVPYTRGHEVSRPIDDIVGEVVDAVRHGAKEVTLLGQNVNSFGKETKKALWNSEELKWNSGVGGIENNAIDSPLGGVVEDWDGGNVRRFEQDIQEGPSWGKKSLFPYWKLPKNSSLQGYAKSLRKAGIHSEVRFWQIAKAIKEQFSFDLDRQKIIGDYIVDFFLPELGLVFEVDGVTHDEKEIYDTKRDAFLKNLGLDVHHTSGYEVMQNSSGVFDWVIDVCEKRKKWLSGKDTSTPLSPQEGKIEAHLSQDFITQVNRSPLEEAFKTPFRELLEQLNDIKGLDRIRFTSSNPHDMTRDILGAHFDLPKMCNYLHFALQSGDNDLLKKMNRKHSYDDFKSMVEYLRSRDPLFGVSTDVIVGFPGETDDQFENTMQAFRECQFDFAYIARYSPRKLTYAAKMSGQVPADVKAQRWDRLNSLMYEIIQERNKLMIGREEVILVSKIDEEDGTISGRSRNFKEVFLPKSDTIKIGDLVPVRIIGLDRWVLKGDVI